uniref:Uncharacterized protein n=1 Tax=Rhizophora mucronata TaxID=61149 RepID=A0A2P2KPD6_RHIMU
MTFRIASAYSSTFQQRYPVCCPSSSKTISIFGPAELWAIGMAPAAIYSTTLMPKCSSTIECIPAMAPPKSLIKSLYVTFLWNSTNCLMFNSIALSCKFCSLSSSALFRQLPTNWSLGLGKSPPNFLMASDKASS